MVARNAQEIRRQELLGLLRPLVASVGFDLEDVTVTAAGRRSLICVVIDSDSGVDLDAVAQVARAVSDVLDDESSGTAAFTGPYVLEVTSPGTDRLLTEPRHWRRAAGRLVSTSVDGEPVRGRVLTAGGELVSLDVEGTSREFALASLAPGRVEVEFSRPGGADPAGLEDDLGEEIDHVETDSEVFHRE